MAGTYSQIHIQAVFAVKRREHFILPEWKGDLCRYIAGIIEGKGQKSIIVNGVSDHIHVFFGLRPSMCLSDLMRDIKNNSSKFVNENKLCKHRFEWQEGYGAFSYSKSHINRVYNYVLNQEQHHQQQSFKEEYTKLLEYEELDFNEKYLFDWLE